MTRTKPTRSTKRTRCPFCGQFNRHGAACNECLRIIGRFLIAHANTRPKKAA